MIGIWRHIEVQNLTPLMADHEKEYVYVVEGVHYVHTATSEKVRNL